jgi:PAS domain S-box-containing protein
MSQKKLDILERALSREKSARKQAEKILENKSAELYDLSEKLSKANAKLKSSIEEKTSELKGVFENIIDAYVVVDLRGVAIKMNDAAIEMLGFDYRLKKVNLFHLTDPKDRSKVINGFSNLVKVGVLTNFHIEIITKNNEFKIVQINASIIHNIDGVPIAAQGIVRDITKERKAQEQLIASENRLSTLIFHLDTGVVLVDENNTITIANKRLCNYFSLDEKPKLLEGMDYFHFVEKHNILFQNFGGFIERTQELILNKKLVLGDELVMANGKILEIDYIPIFEEKKFKGNLWSYKDVTLKHNYSQSIESEKQKYSSIIANMNLGLLEVDLQDKILYANQSFVTMSGYSYNELVGNIAKDIFLKKEQKQILIDESLNRLKDVSNSYEMVVSLKNNRTKNWLISGAPQYNINGEITGSIGIHLDITEFRNLEIQKEILLKKLEKSNSELEEYAYIVSHDLKSPLRSLDALVSWLKEDNEGKFDNESLRNFELIEKTLEKMEKLISGILEYSSINSGSIKREEVDLNEIINGLHFVLLIPDHIELKIKNSLPKVMGDATKFQQLFLNIVSNAIRYIDKSKGIVEIDVKEFHSYYQFSIRDNGIGIEKKDFNRIFKIFQSLTNNKESSGIGLSIVKKIVHLYQGEIWLESEVGLGTVFYFTITKQ